MIKIELKKDLGMRQVGNGRKRFGLYTCHCGNDFEMRSDVFNHNIKIGKQNGCSKKCKSAIRITTEPRTGIYCQDVEDGKWDDTMFGDDFDRFFTIEPGWSIFEDTCIEGIKEKLKSAWINKFKHTGSDKIDHATFFISGIRIKNDISF